MKENITAQWAKETANKVLNEKIQNQILKPLTSIESAVKNNEFSTTVYSDLHELAIKELQERGFVVKYNSTTYQIKWD